ncbi:MAG: exodeoxyribonuclease V subunit gamma [Defluviitaleaceae bacterium]|nr:exodeoxyribonuclease V subunit gamma [Defluviitaleaceae bacterium]
MALRFIFGTAGSGKTTYCTEDIINLANLGKSPLYYIVPEQYTLEAEKNLVAKFAAKSVIKAQVLSFERLSYHVLSETGAKQGGILDSVGKSMVIRKVLYDTLPKLKYYNKTPISPGFVKNISHTIKELYQYEKTGESLEVSGMVSINQANKFEDIGLVFNAYKDFVGKGYISSDTTLDTLNDHIYKSKLFHNAVIWIDNFTGFTPQEYRVIGNLLQLAAQVNICVNIDSDVMNYANISYEDIYFESKFLVNKLAAIAKEQRVEVIAAVFLEGSHRFKNSPELKWILDNYMDVNPEAFSNKNERVLINSFPNKYLETKAVADNIIRLVRDKGFKFSEIAVLPGDMEGYTPILQNTFERYNIPYFIDLRIGILFHPLTEFIRALFEITMKNWSHESVFRLLKTNLLEFSEDEIDILENYVIEYGIRGGKWKYDEWKYGFSQNSPYDKDSIHAVKEAVYSTISEFSGKYTPKSKVRPLDICTAIYKFLLGLKIPDKLTKLAMDSAKDGDMYLYRIHAGIWNVHMSVLEKIAEIFDPVDENMYDTQMTFTEFAEILFMGLSSCDMGIIPPSQDQVIVGDIYRSRLSDIKALFIIGMTSDMVPKKPENEGLLDDNDKVFLEKSGIELGVSSDKQIYINSHRIFGVLTKASDCLFLYYPERDFGGKQNTPSSILWKIRKLFTFDEESVEDNIIDYITVPKSMLEKLGEDILPELDMALTNWYLESSIYGSQMRKSLKGTTSINLLSYEVLSSLYKKDIVTSVSRLERYVECPFSYFLRYNLRVKERADYKVRNVDLGNVFHDTLESFDAYLRENNVDWENLNYSNIDKVVEELFVNFDDNSKSDIFSYDAKSGYILEQVKKISKRSIWALGTHLKSGDFKPYGAEIDFNSGTGITVDINNFYRFILTGRIDRVDLMEKNGKTYVKIIDYKSGSKKFDPTDIYYGRQLQLLTYMGALAQEGDKILDIPVKPNPGGLFYFKFDDPVVKYSENTTDTDIYNDVFSKFKMTGLLINDKEVIEGVDKNITKSSQVISVNLNKEGEYISRSDTLVSKEGFEELIHFAQKKTGEIGKKIISGNIEVRPYKRGMQTGCDYCPYISICGFGDKSRGGQYNNFRKIKSLGDLK